MSKSKKTLGYLALLASTFIWGTSFVILKNTLDSVSVLWVLAIRFLGASLIMLLASLKKLRTIGRGYLKGGIAMGVLLYTAYIFQTYGLMYTTPGKNAFLTATYAILVPFLGWMFFRKRPGKYNLIAAALCLTGVGLVSLTGEFRIGSGDLLSLICSLFFALHIIQTGVSAEGRDTLLLTFIQLATAAVLSWIAALVFEPFPKDIPGGAAVSIVYLCLMCTAACFFLQTFGQKYTSSNAAAIILTLESVFGAFFSVLFYHEHLTVRLTIGFILIFISIIISETKLSFLKKKENGPQ